MAKQTKKATSNIVKQNRVAKTLVDSVKKVITKPKEPSMQARGRGNSAKLEGADTGRKLVRDVDVRLGKDKKTGKWSPEQHKKAEDKLYRFEVGAVYKQEKMRKEAKKKTKN